MISEEEYIDTKEGLKDHLLSYDIDKSIDIINEINESSESIASQNFQLFHPIIKPISSNSTDGFEKTRSVTPVILSTRPLSKQELEFIPSFQIIE